MIAVIEINEDVARNVLKVIDAGLCAGVGEPTTGKMCVEAAVCYALDLPHGDDPGCVSAAVRTLKIALNDKAWSSNPSRAAGLRRLGLVQLGSKDVVDDTEFAIRVSLLVYKDPGYAAWAAAWLSGADRSKEAADSAADYAARSAADYAARSAASAAYYAACSAADSEAYYAADYAARSAADFAADSAASAADYAAYDKSLSDFAEQVVQVLVDMKAPGCRWLPLTETV